MGSIYGYELESELPLGRLRGSPGLRGRLRLERGPEDLLDQPGELIAWNDWGLDGRWFALARCDRALLASWSTAGTFEIDPGAGRIRVLAPKFGDLSEHRLATSVIPLLLAERGDVALHASVVTVDGGAVLFCGPSGRGKSTLALRSFELGHAVLSEDGAVVELGEECVVWPGLQGVVVEDDLSVDPRPMDDGASNGAPVARRRRLRMLAGGPDAARPAPVAAICQVAERGIDLSVRRLSPAEAVPTLVPSLIHAGGPDSFRAAFALLARLVERAPVYRVSMPDGISRAGAATDVLLEEIAS
jgi:hypothetical protein